MKLCGTEHKRLARRMAVFATAPTAASGPWFHRPRFHTRQNHMYLGGILGTILVVCLIVWLVRRV
jgi:hypothetical protein